MAPPEQTLPPILPPGVFLLPQPNAQLPPGATPLIPAVPAVPAVPSTTNATAGKRPHQVTPVNSHPVPSVSHTPVATEPRRGKMPVYASGPASNTNIMANTTPVLNETKFNPVNLPVSNYPPKPVYDNNYPMPAAPSTYPSIKLKTNTSYTATPTNGHHQPPQVNVTPVMPQPEPAPAAEPQTEHDTTHDELDFETGFDLDGVFVNDSQDDHHIDGLNTSSYFSLS